MISMINGVSAPTASLQGLNKTDAKSTTNFSNLLKKTIESLNQSEKAADIKTEELMNGEVEDLHTVMIAAQKASIELETTVQIQKKVIDAYNEIMRMQV